MATRTVIERGRDALLKRRAARADMARHRSFADNEALMAMKPREGYVFHDDYVEVDDGVMTILCLWHNGAGVDNFGPFWGVNLIPTGLPPEVTVINVEQVNRMSDKWIQDHQTDAESVANKNAEQQGLGGTNNTKSKAAKAVNDMTVIAEELSSGASYLHVQARLIVKAPDLKTLDFAIDRIEALYADAHRFTTIKPATHDGAMREELSNIFRPNAQKRGKGAYFTSTEYAGEYNLVTHGLEDPHGEYVGVMTGDVNNAAVIFDVDGFDHHVVVATDQFNDRRSPGHRVAASDMWCAKLGQAALLNGHRVCHMLLGDDCDMSTLGPTFPRISRTLDMTHGAINMFQVFGEPGTELAAFPQQMVKLTLMAEQAYETTESDRSIIRGSLEEVATRFYRYQRMWPENAKQNQDRIRILGLPNDQYPLLQRFVTYLDQAYEAMARQDTRDEEKLHALSVLSLTFRNLLSNNGDLFNQPTDPGIEDAMHARRVIYDFSGLTKRGHGVAMAQLVNVIDLAASHLGRGDVLIMHSAQNVDDAVKGYVTDQLDKLWHRGGRVVFAYDEIEPMLAAQEFNKFDAADYTLLGNMRDTVMDEYQRRLGRPVPPSLSELVTDKGDAIMYCRRGYDNIIFKQDLLLDIDDKARMRREARFN